MIRSLFAGQSISLADFSADGVADRAVGFEGRRLVRGTHSGSCTSMAVDGAGRLIVGGYDGPDALLMIFDGPR